MAPQLLGIADVAETLGVSTFTLRRLIKAGQVRAVKMGSRVLVSQVEVDRLVEQGTETAKQNQ